LLTFCDGILIALIIIESLFEFVANNDLTLLNKFDQINNMLVSFLLQIIFLY